MKNKKFEKILAPGPAVVLDAKEEEIYKALRQTGLLDGHMLTFAGPKDTYRVDAEWFRDEVHSMCRAFFEAFRIFPQYEIVMNRGWSGIGKWSCHMVFKNECPGDINWLVRYWNDKFGPRACVPSSHGDCLRYYVKNLGEPDARSHAGVYNRRNTPKRGKGFRGVNRRKREQA